MTFSSFSPRSLTGVGTSESASASGCAMSERVRPEINKRTTSHASHSEMDGLAVFTWGRGEDGQLGLGDTSDQDEPTYVDSLRGVGVRQIACGSGHTVVLSTEGEVFTWGRGDDGRLGHGDNGWKYVPRITQALAGQVVVQVTCGSYHTAAVTGNGDLYTWGGGMYGKLGHGNEAGHSTPKRVEALVGLNVSQIACGSRHTAIITSSGAIYTWGDKENGVAGHGDTEGHQYTPKLLERLAGKRIVQLSACGFHTGCLTAEGELFTWGEGKFGRLGHGAERNCHSPRLVETLIGKKPRQVSCGGFHTAVVTEDGHLYTFGGGEHGQLGHNDRVNKVKPTMVQALEDVFVSQITCGWSHSVALTSKGRIYTWGNGDHGKLGHGSGRKVSVPTMVEKLKEYRVVRVASYNEHTAALVEPFDHTQGLAGGAGAVPVTTSYSSQMRALVNDEEFSDVTFLVEDTPVYAHRAILAQRCDHFAAMFRSGMRESVELMVPIPDISRKVFLVLLEYIYTDSVKIDVEHAIELYIAADIYQLERLRDMCCTVVRRNLNAENAGPLLQIAEENHCLILRDVCMSYIVENFDIVSKTDGIKQVSHELLLEILGKR
ncbi:regulator of chromosome condensation RCC1 repeat protein [Nitzschia inconspicua]|uniref:Regulator of chromosome condensation RCC1 repeat protein n=1 Tax=Nitzschia inconspicua TaxID=303405 RepID=A0A9K3PX65_9STRA|nr:regulator of chromosome condensation RCC1 repeat protein [Nitzschia inconspicua]KAG7362681.1 regulator of chromosome condensation RCC1 repeat protein [Nitzschia inconspicua]